MRKIVDIELLVKTIHAEFCRVADPGAATSHTLSCVRQILKVDSVKAIKIVSPIIFPAESNQ